MKWIIARSVVAGIILSCLVQSSAYAVTITTYTSLAGWQAAVQGSSQFTETFQSVTQDTDFETAPVNLPNFSLQQIGHDQIFGDFRNFIDVPPLQFSDNDGNTNAALYTKSGINTVNMLFSSPVYAWGANFFGAQSGELDSLVLTAVGGSVIATVPVTVDTGFFGFVVSPKQGLSGITFESRLNNPDPTIGQGFGLENITGALLVSVGTPEPSSILLVGIGLAFMTSIFRGRKLPQGD